MRQSPCSTAEIQQALHDPHLEVLSNCVLYNFESDEHEAYAVVSRGGGRDVTIGGRPVFLLAPNAPLSAHLLECRPGEILSDIFLCYQVVSVNGSPIMTKAERQRCCRQLQEASRCYS